MRPLGPGLVGDESHAQHVAGDVGGFVGRLRELDAAAFAAAAGVDLRLDDHDAASFRRCAASRASSL